MVLRAAVVVVGVSVIVVGGVVLRCSGRLKGRERGSRAERGGLLLLEKEALSCI